MKTREIDQVVLYMPERSDIENLKVGDMALNCFGEFARVRSINCKKEDIEGKLFVLYYTQFADHTSAISMSLKEGELARTASASRHFTSDRLREIEKDMREGN